MLCTHKTKGFLCLCLEDLTPWVLIWLLLLCCHLCSSSPRVTKPLLVQVCTWETGLCFSWSPGQSLTGSTGLQKEVRERSPGPAALAPLPYSDSHGALFLYPASWVVFGHIRPVAFPDFQSYPFPEANFALGREVQGTEVSTKKINVLFPIIP